MRLKLALLTSLLAFGFGMPAAFAEDAPGAKNDITIAGAADQAPADQAPAAKDDEQQGAPAPEEGGAAAPDSGDSGSTELPPPASE